MASFWTLESVKGVLGGTWLARPSEESALGGASIDSRVVNPGQIFFALRGERVDGHAFVRGALERGAGLAIVDRPDALEAGLVVWPHGGQGPGGHGDLVMLAPPFVITERDIDELVARLHTAIAHVSSLP